MNDRIPFLVGSVVLKSNLSINKVGEILSERIFSGLKFQGEEECIYEEVPAIYIKSSFLGLQIILSGYSGFGEADSFVLEIIQNNFIKNVEIKRKECKLDGYLYSLLKEEIHDIKEITIFENI